MCERKIHLKPFEKHIKGKNTGCTCLRLVGHGQNRVQRLLSKGVHGGARANFKRGTVLRGDTAATQGAAHLSAQELLEALIGADVCSAAGGGVALDLWRVAPEFGNAALGLGGVALDLDGAAL